jgi:hypothetical protein
MKTKLNLGLGILFFLCPVLNAQEVPSEFNMNSLKESVFSIEWNEFTEFLHRETGPCKDDLISKLRLLPTTPLEKKHYNELLKDMRVLFEKVDETANKHDFGGLYYENGMNIPREYWPDKIFMKLNSSNNADDFIEKFRTKQNGSKVKLSKAEEADLREIYTLYSTKTFGTKLELTYDKIPFGDCTLERALQIELFSVSAIRVVWTVRLIAYVKCECTALSTPLKLESANVHLEIPMVMTLTEMNINTSRFWPPKGKDTRPRLKIQNIKCCSAPNDEDQNPGDDDQPENDNGKGKDDHGYNPQNSTNQNCCTSETATNTIAIKPGIALTDNIENFCYDIAIEYARNLGNSAGDNEIFAGAEVGYMGTETQEGEVKQNMVYGGIFIENRTPISECGDVQWVQGINGRYGMGTIDAFGRKDDFTMINYGIHTGFNFDICDEFSIGAQVGVLNLGNITYKNDEVEIKEDIGDLTINKGMPVRFGFRFRF